MWFVFVTPQVSLLLLSACVGLVLNSCPSGSITRFLGTRCTTYSNSLYKSWGDANEYCVARGGRLLRIDGIYSLSSVRYGIPYVSSSNGRLPLPWIGGFTNDFHMISEPPTTVPNLDLSTQTPGNNTNSTAFNPFSLYPDAKWYWSNVSNPAPGNSTEISNPSVTASISIDNATGGCLATDRYTIYAQDCEAAAKFVCEYECVTRISSVNASEIVSPNHPSSYPANANCEWYIDVQQGFAVLEFERFMLEGSCSYDYIKVYEFKNSSRYLSMQCGTSPPGRIVSPSRYMYIKFQTDGSGQYIGFKGTVRSSSVPVVTTYNDTHGIVSTDAFPDFYSSNTSQRWQVVTGGTINLRFTDFDLQPGNGSHCIYDSLQVRELSATGRILGTFCGDQLPANLSSQTGALYFTLTTDGTVQKTGFRAIYWSSTVPCIRILTDGYGEISTPNYPSAYTLGDCVWYLDVLDGIAKLAANRVPSGSYSSSCATAQLEVYDSRVRRLSNSYGTSTRLGIYCGSSRPTNLRSGSRYMMIKFSSSGGYNSGYYAKFSAKYRSSTNCSQTIVAADGTGVVTSPEYPSYYDPYSNCSWLLDIGENTTLTLKFNTFAFQSHSRCYYDKFTAYDGNSTAARSLGTFCGTSVPPHIKSTGRYLFLTMTTDGTSQSRGFSAEFWSADIKCTRWGISNVFTRSFNNTCFGLINATRSWTSARTFCESKNSSLVRFESEAKFNAIKEWLFTDLGHSSTLGIWTAGYRRSSYAHNWYWSTLHGDSVVKDGHTNNLWDAYNPHNSTTYIFMLPSGLRDTNYANHYTLCEEHKPVTGEVTVRPPGSCSAPPFIRAGTYIPTKEHYADGDNITYHCDSGAPPIGNDTISCKAGFWLPATPICRPPHTHRWNTTPSTSAASCRPPPAIHYGTFSPTSASYKNGSKITIKCSPGYRLQDDGPMQCVNGHWQGFLSACVRDRGAGGTGGAGGDQSKGGQGVAGQAGQVYTTPSADKGRKSLVAGTVSIILILIAVIVVLVVREVIRRRRQGQSQLLMEME